MTKTIKICDKCGNEYCEECTRKIIEKVNDIVLRQNF